MITDYVKPVLLVCPYKFDCSRCERRLLAGRDEFIEEGEEPN